MTDLPPLLLIEHFQPALGQDFTIPCDDGSLYRLRLADIKPLPDHPYPNQVRAPFSLFFTGSGPHVLDQGIYRLTNPVLGQVDITLVPIARLGDDVRYQASYT